MQLRLHALLFFSSLIAFAWAAYPNPIPGTDTVGCRDPAVLYRPESRSYFMFSTGKGVRIFKAPALDGPWKQVGQVMPNCSKVDNPGRCELWAADVAKIKDQYVLYYSASKGGSQKSVIGVATSKTMEPGSWTDHGAVIRSDGSKNFNAIDPNIINANGLKLTFGSYWGGMFQIDMKDFKTPKNKTLPGRHLAGHSGRPAEGGFIYKSRDQPQWYYFFFSDGQTIFDKGRPAKGREYKVRVGRSKSPTGPFLDKTGDPITKKMKSESGSLVLESHGNVYAPGGQSLFRDPVSKRDVIAYHWVLKDKGGGARFGMNYIDFKSGWPKIVTAKVVKPKKPEAPKPKPTSKTATTTKTTAKPTPIPTPTPATPTTSACSGKGKRSRAHLSA